MFLQVATPSRERVEQYRLLRDDIDRLVGRINGDTGRLGRPPIIYLHNSYPREEMAAMYRAADVMVVTPLRDGMNLVAKEYVACRDGDNGALVLSEFTGAAKELRQAYLVNPHDIDGLKSTHGGGGRGLRPQQGAPDADHAPARVRARHRPLGRPVPGRPEQAGSGQRLLTGADVIPTRTAVVEQIPGCAAPGPRAPGGRP